MGVTQATTLLSTHQLGIGYQTTGRWTRRSARQANTLVVGREINLQIDTGRIVCLLGPNGSGKTTLLRTLLGLLPALSGKVVVNGQSLADMSRQSIARHLAFVPQAVPDVFAFRVLDMVMMGRTAHLGAFAQPGTDDVQAARQALQTLGIAALADAHFPLLSGGQQQLVLIARALAQRSELIVMDEPAASLDFGNQVTLMQRLGELVHGFGHSVLMSTHDPQHALTMQADVLVMKSGSIVASGPAVETLTGEMLSDVYGTPIRVETAASGNPVCYADAPWPAPASPSSG